MSSGGAKRAGACLNGGVAKKGKGKSAIRNYIRYKIKNIIIIIIEEETADVDTRSPPRVHDC
jgi:hypothetical protein